MARTALLGVSRIMWSALLVLSCTRNGAPCAAPNCGSGYECLANTCSPLGTEPVPKDTLRVVIEPASVASANATEASAGAVDLGRDWAALFLRFDASWKREGTVVRAFLLLEPGEAGTDAEDLALEVWRVEAPWTAARIAVGARPKLGPPRARGLLRTSPPTTARIDVTNIALALAKTPEDHGLAVLSSDSGSGAVRTGATGGAPRLELYVRASR